MDDVGKINIFEKLLCLCWACFARFIPHRTLRARNPPLRALIIILKVWLVFCVLWGIYIYLLGDLRFVFLKRTIPEDHWLGRLIMPFEYFGIPSIGELLRLVMMSGVAIPFALAYYATKKIYSACALIDLMIYIALLQAILYVTSILIDYTLLIVCNSQLMEVLKTWNEYNIIDFFISTDRLYVYAFVCGVIVAAAEILVRTLIANWGRRNGTT